MSGAGPQAADERERMRRQISAAGPGFAGAARALEATGPGFAAAARSLRAIGEGVARLGRALLGAFGHLELVVDDPAERRPRTARELGRQMRDVVAHEFWLAADRPERSPGARYRRRRADGA